VAQARRAPSAASRSPKAAAAADFEGIKRAISLQRGPRAVAAWAMSPDPPAQGRGELHLLATDWRRMAPVLQWTRSDDVEPAQGASAARPCGEIFKSC